MATDADGEVGSRRPPPNDKPRNQGPDGPNGAKPLKIDLPFEEAVRRFMKAPPIPKEVRTKRERRQGKQEGGGRDG
jgi:hypothetical protein